MAQNPFAVKSHIAGYIVRRQKEAHSLVRKPYPEEQATLPRTPQHSHVLLYYQHLTILRP